MSEEIRTEVTEQPEKVETMEDFKDALERSFRKLREGDIIKGTIIDISETVISVDLQYYAPGILPMDEISDDPALVIDEHYAVGDEIQATIIRMDDGKGNILLSLKEATEVLAWDTLKEKKEQETVFSVKIVEAVKAGVIAYADGIRGFIPASQLDLNYVEAESLSEWINKTVEVVVTTVDEDDHKLILSAKIPLQKKRADEMNNKISHLVPGSVFEGTVETIMPYGAFINLGDGLSGLLHISRICQKRIQNPSEVLKVGQEVRVKLIDVKDNKLSLSMKEFEDIMDAGEVDSTETFDYKEEGNVTTSLGDLFKNLKF